MRRALSAAASLLILCAAAAPSARAANTAPKAQHLVYRVAPGQTVEVSLVGYDTDGDTLQATLTRLPATGSLFDLSQVYSTHGHAPTHSDATRIAAANHAVPAASRLRVVYAAPRAGAPQAGQLASFAYTLSDGKAASAQGRVTLIVDAQAEHVLVRSDFRADADGWTIVGNSARTGAASAQPPVHERSSYGLLNHFIYAVDEHLDVDARGADRRLWAFSAPSHFLGFQAWAYGGRLSFSLGAFSGDLTAQRDAGLNLVELECSSCALGAGMRFAYRLRDVTFDGAPTRVSLPLSEASAWLKLSKNALQDPVRPSQCEFVEMLETLSAMRILGDMTPWYETIGLDDVQLEAKEVGRRQALPVACL